MASSSAPPGMLARSGAAASSCLPAQDRERACRGGHGQPRAGTCQQRSKPSPSHAQRHTVLILLQAPSRLAARGGRLQRCQAPPGGGQDARRSRRCGGRHCARQHRRRQVSGADRLRAVASCARACSDGRAVRPWSSLRAPPNQHRAAGQLEDAPRQPVLLLPGRRRVLLLGRHGRALLLLLLSWAGHPARV